MRTLHDTMRAQIKAFIAARPLDDGDCFYCSAVAVARDHTIPHSFTRTNTTPRQFLTDCVPACQECNSLLSNKLHISLLERFSYLLEKVSNRHRKIIASPSWSDSEMAEMGFAIQNDIREMMLRKVIAIHRIKRLSDNCATLAKRNRPKQAIHATYSASVVAGMKIIVANR